MASLIPGAADGGGRQWLDVWRENNLQLSSTESRITILKQTTDRRITSSDTDLCVRLDLQCDSKVAANEMIHRSCHPRQEARQSAGPVIRLPRGIWAEGWVCYAVDGQKALCGFWHAATCCPIASLIALAVAVRFAGAEFGMALEGGYEAR